MKGIPRTPEVRKKLAIAQTGKKHTAEAKFKCAENVRLGISGPKRSFKNRFTCQQGREFQLRSSWERVVAEYLDSQGVHWDYEPEVIKLSDGNCYLPDFKLADGSYIEVKGYMDEKDAAKIALAREAGYKVEIFDGAKLKTLGILPSKKSG